MLRRSLIKPLAFIILIAFLAAIPLIIRDRYWLDVFIFLLINTVLATSLRLVFSTGQISFAHPGLAAIGGYSSGVLALKSGLSFWVTLPIGGLMAALVALIIGYPILRLKGVYFFLISFIFTLVIGVFMGNFWIPTFGGYRGLLNIPSPSPLTIPGLGRIEFTTEMPFYYLTLFIALVTIIVLFRLERSRFGLVFNSIRDADAVAESVGISLIKYKVLAFVIGGFFAGIAGSLFAHYQHIITPYDFDLHSGIYTFIYIVVGGMGTVFGPILGTTVLRLLAHPLRHVGLYEPMILGIILILFLIFIPGGMISLPQRVASWTAKLGTIGKRLSGFYPFRRSF